MKKKSVFLLFWGLYFIVPVLIVLFAVFLFDWWSIFWLLVGIAWFIFVLWLRWRSKLIVLPEWVVVAEWCGNKMEPLTNGYHYPFRKFGFFNVVAEVPMNKQTLYILSGVRDNLAPELINQYTYGTASNIEPDTGDYLRLLYRVEVKCVNPLALVYNINNPYDYVAGIIEHKVSLYVHRKKSEDIIDHFSEQTLSSIFSASATDPVDVRNQILSDTGLELLTFIPIDVINTPEVEAIREKLDTEQRQSAIIKAQVENETQREEGKGKVLNAKLANMSVQEAIGQKSNDILVNKINAIKSNAGVNGDEALKFIAKEKTLETLEKSSETGNITYIDDSGFKGNLNQAAALGFAISATNKK